MFRFEFRPVERWTLAALSAAFLLGCVTGFALSGASPEFAQAVYRGLRQEFGRLLELSGWRLVLAIFFNNFRVGLLLIVVGAIVPLFPFLALYANGFIIGLVSWLFGERYRSFLPFFMGLLPHGILELPAVFLAAVVGTVIGLENWRNWLGAAPGRSWRETVKIAGKRLALIALLLIPAAVIEVFISPMFLPHRQ